MAKNWLSQYWQLGLVGTLAILGMSASLGDGALAQITPDATLGTESSVVTPNVNINGIPGDQIDGGAVRGANLFHSFEQFSIPTGSAAYFNNALGIQNIISRVTGTSISNIDGLIRANGSTNLFLINPNGIIFGPNATLAIGGSFLGSTANSVNLADGTIFSATTPQTVPLLTVSVPVGLQYQGNTGRILNQSRATNSSGGTGLQVLPGKTLTLVGGNVSLESGIVQAPDGQIQLGGVVEPATVGLNSDSSLSFPTGVRQADVSLSNGAAINVSGNGSGRIALNARNIDVLGASTLRANREPGLGAVNPQPGDITLNATDTITVANNSNIASEVRLGAVGNGGSINIMAGSVSVTDGAQLSAATRGRGNGGNVNITARDMVSFDGKSSDRTSEVNVTLQVQGVGKGGSINITAGSLSVTNGARLAANTAGRGDAGNVSINARDTVSLRGRVSSGERTSVVSEVRGETAVGNGGDITITTGSLFVTDGAQLSASTFGQGNAGNVTILAQDTVSFDTALAITRALQEAQGLSGDITIATRSLSVTNGGFLSANTFGQGNAGNVTIRARDRVLLDGVGPNGNLSRVVSNVESKEAVGNGGNVDITTGALSVANAAFVGARTLGQGDGGNIIINADTLEAINGGQILTASTSSGKAGNITLNVTDSITLAGIDPTFATRLAQFGDNVVSVVGPASGVFANTLENSTGQGGGLRINTGQLVIQDGAEVNVSSKGSGNAGNIEVAARSIRLENQASLSSDTTAGQGDIILRSQDLVLRRASNITTNAQGIATGGNITIDSDVIAALEDSDISANAEDASGGRVKITAQGIFGTEFREDETSESDITATSERGLEFSGTVELNTPDIDPNQGLVALPTELVDASNQIATGCAGGGESLASNQFIITGRGGLPPNPTETLNGEAVLTEWATLEPGFQNRSGAVINPTRDVAPTQIVEAQGWVIDANANVVLTAQASTVTPYTSGVTSATCHKS